VIHTYIHTYIRSPFSRREHRGSSIMLTHSSCARSIHRMHMHGKNYNYERERGGSAFASVGVGVAGRGTLLELELERGIERETHSPARSEESFS
jgi:hypothetical protein